MTKFTIALREIGTYKEVLRSQVVHFLFRMWLYALLRPNSCFSSLWDTYTRKAWKWLHLETSLCSLLLKYQHVNVSYQMVFYGEEYHYTLRFLYLFLFSSEHAPYVRIWSPKNHFMLKLQSHKIRVECDIWCSLIESLIFIMPWHI